MVQGIQYQNNTITGLSQQKDGIKTTSQITSSQAQPINQPEADTFVSTVKGCAPWLLLFEGIPLFKYLKNIKLIGKYGSKETVNFAQSASKTIAQTNKTALKALADKSNGSILKRIGKYIETADETKKAYHSVRSAINNEGKAAKLAKTIAEKTAKGKNASHLETKLSKKLASSAKNLQEAGKSVKALETAGKTTSKFSRFMKSSGATVMLVFSGVMEMISEVIPTFKELGVEKGLKQLGKSAIKVVGDTTGFIAGEQIGTALGTAIGTALFPGVGSIIGGAVGFIGGMVGSWAAGKVLNPIIGKSEREKAAEQNLQTTDTNLFTATV